MSPKLTIKILCSTDCTVCDYERIKVILMNVNFVTAIKEITRIMNLTKDRYCKSFPCALLHIFRLTIIGSFGYAQAVKSTLRCAQPMFGVGETV